MISDTNKAFCDLASATYGKGWQVILPVAGIVADEHRARTLSAKHDIDPQPKEMAELVRAAREKKAEIDEMIAALNSAAAVA